MRSRYNGFVTLLSVLILAAVSTAVSVSLLVLGLASSRTSFSLQQLHEAKSLADTCAETALQKVRDTTSFSGTGGVNLGTGSCSYTVTAQSGEQRTITASGVVGSLTRKVKITITQINPSITISAWQEVADFL
jgi:hypothetical protein